jgi:hypothetical protein
MVFLVTRAVVKEECQRVFGVDRPSTWERIRSILTRTTANEATAAFIDKNLLTFLEEKQLFPLGRLVFDADTGALRDPSQLAGVKTAWEARLDGNELAHRAVWVPPGTASSSRYDLEASEIEGAIPPSAQITREKVPSLVAPIEVAIGEAESAGRCPVVTFLVGAEPVAVRMRRALVIFASADGPDHFFGDDAPATRMRFVDDVPEGDLLRKFIGALTPNQRVLGVTLAVLTPPVDGGADARLKAVIEELRGAGQNPQRAATTALTAHDRQQLKDTGHPLDGLDEVIFLEPNG